MKKSLSILNLFRKKKTITVHKTIKRELLIEKYDVNRMAFEKMLELIYSCSIFDNI